MIVFPSIRCKRGATDAAKIVLVWLSSRTCPLTFGCLAGAPATRLAGRRPAACQESALRVHRVGKEKELPAERGRAESEQGPDVWFRGLQVIFCGTPPVSQT